MRIAIAQFDYQPAYWGPYGCFYREPTFCEEPIVTEIALNASVVNEFAKTCEKSYLEAHAEKIAAILNGLEDKEIDILVFPEYSINPQLLPLLSQKAKELDFTIVAASHIVQADSQSYYDGANLQINAESSGSDVRKSCCPIFFNDGTSTVIYKEHQSKWENNITPDSSSKTFTIPGTDEKVTVNLCIDALTEGTYVSKILITPAESPVTDKFYDVGRHLLLNEKIMVFCNHSAFGGSTIFCHIPKASNALFGAETHVTPMIAGEETIMIIDVEEDKQFLKRGSVQTLFPAKVVSVLPILHHDNADARLLMDIHDNLENNEFDEALILASLSRLSGLARLRMSLLRSAVENGTIRNEEYSFYTDYILVDTQPLQYLRFKLLKAALETISHQFTIKPSSLGANGINAMARLGEEYERMAQKIPIISDDDPGQEFDDSQFQNRSKGINAFRSCLFSQEYSQKTIFALEGMKGIGKATLCKKLGKLFSFSSIIVTLPDVSGWYRLINSICSVLKIEADYIDPDDLTIKLLARRIADSLKSISRGILVIRNCGHLFQQQHSDYKLIIQLFINLCRSLEGERIKIILLSDHRIEWPSALIAWIEHQRLTPLGSLYIRRIIEYQSLHHSANFAVDSVPQHVVDVCCGSPIVAKLIGTHIGLKKLSSGILQSLEKFSRFHQSLFNNLMEHLGLNDCEKALLKYAALYRMPVNKTAYIVFKGYTESVFQRLVERFFIEENDGLYEVPVLIKQYFAYSPPSEDILNLHELAANYYSSLFQDKSTTNFSVEHAEYIYHASFTRPANGEMNLRVYSDEILDVAIQLFKKGKGILAFSHLESVSKWKEQDFQYHLYMAKCYAQKMELSKVDFHLSRCIELYRLEDKVWIFCSIIDSLIRARQFDYAESLIMIAREINNVTQLEALHIQLLYHKSQSTKKEAIERALALVKQDYYCLRTSRMIITILTREGLIEEAQKEATKVLSVKPGEKWFEEILQKPEVSDQDNEEVEYFDKTEDA